jgi:hypothetical protein
VDSISAAFSCLAVIVGVVEDDYLASAGASSAEAGAVVDSISTAFSLCLAVIVEVVEDDYLAITRRPENVAVEIAKMLSGEFLIARSINNERGMVEHWGLPGGVALLEHQ